MADLQYDPARGVYLDGGRVVPEATIRANLSAIVTDSADRLQVLAERYLAGRLSLQSWQASARQELRTSYVLAGTLAAGGRKQLSPSVRGLMGHALREQYGFLRGLGEALAANQAGFPDAQSEGQLLARARMYAGGAWATYERVADRGALARGQDRVRNRLGGGEHCAQCEALTARGWVPRGAMPLPGSRTCLTACHCSLEYTTAAALATQVAEEAV